MRRSYQKAFIMIEGRTFTFKVEGITHDRLTLTPCNPKIMLKIHHLFSPFPWHLSCFFNPFKIARHYHIIDLKNFHRLELDKPNIVVSMEDSIKSC